MRIDFWQIEAERAGDAQSYAVVPSILKNWEKCGAGGLVGHGSSIDVIYIGAQAAGRWWEPNGPF